jgi:gliding motility-associated-like protein
VRQVYDKITVEVFNRWGKLVYDSDQFYFWDGKNKKGAPVPVGTYYYVMTLDGFHTHGYVTVLK